MTEDLLDEHRVGPYLSSRGIDLGGIPDAELLTGGVSNVVLSVRGQHTDCVVKQSLGRLRVADEWYAPRDRVMTEASALELAGRLTPGCVPRLLDRDAVESAIVLERAPACWQDWKTLLLGGDVRPTVARRLGEILGSWHRMTTERDRLPVELRKIEPFEQLRIDPYYRTTAERVPELAAEILALAEALTSRRSCLVHGDFSPKNVLVAPGVEQVWVIDFEVAHYGDPAFDLAFLITHLLLKAIHLPDRSQELAECLMAFAGGYEGSDHPQNGPPPADAGRPGSVIDWPYVTGHVGALLLARVHGKSPVEYLSGDEPNTVQRLGSSLLINPAATLAEVATRMEVTRTTAPDL